MDSFLDRFSQAISNVPELPQHGGQLKAAIAASDIPAEQWIDLSTGINPNPWPVPKIPENCFQRLPEPEDELIAVARDYYLSDFNQKDNIDILAIPGSQWFIQTFPGLFNNTQAVTLPKLGYAEHAFWWEQYHHSLSYYDDSELNSLLSEKIESDIVVIINPNNPTIHSEAPELIINAAQQNLDTLFIVDEAFVDSQPSLSLTQYGLPENILILRSLGKFFGLAGIRVGFIIGHHRWLPLIRPLLGPWPIANASIWIAKHALKDRAWQSNNIVKLTETAHQLATLLDQTLTPQAINFKVCDYYATLTCETQQQAFTLFNKLKQQGVLVRYFENTPLIRIGLPNTNQLEVFKKRLTAINLSNF